VVITLSRIMSGREIIVRRAFATESRPRSGEGLRHLYLQLGGIDKRTIYLIDKNGIVRYPNLKFRASAKEDYQLLRMELIKLQDQPSK